MIAGKQLAELLHEEFERDGWGDKFDLHWVEQAAKTDDELRKEYEVDDLSVLDDYDNIKGVREVLDRVAARLGG
jgi:hypothetical protein